MTPQQIVLVVCLFLSVIIVVLADETLGWIIYRAPDFSMGKLKLTAEETLIGFFFSVVSLLWLFLGTDVMSAIVNSFLAKLVIAVSFVGAMLWLSWNSADVFWRIRRQERRLRTPFF